MYKLTYGWTHKDGRSGEDHVFVYCREAALGLLMRWNKSDNWRFFPLSYTQGFAKDDAIQLCEAGHVYYRDNIRG